MKALHLLKTSVGANWAYLQIKELVRLGVDVSVILPTHGPMSAKYIDDNIPTFFLNTDLSQASRPLSLFQAFRHFRHLIERIKPDIVHSHFVGTTLFARLALNRSSDVLRVFQVPGPLHLERAITRLPEITIAGPQDYWLASCKFTHDIYLRHRVPASRLGLAYYGTDISKFSSIERVDLRSHLGIDPRTSLIGMISYTYRPKRWLGQFRGIKGHEDLVDAAKLLLDRGSDIAVVFVGTAWAGAEVYHNNIVSYAREKLGSRCFFLGFRSDVASVYADLDVAVHPSLSENLGGAAESLLVGVPTVTTNVGGFPDLILEGKTGRLCKPADPWSLANAIDATLRDPDEARAMSLEGQIRARRLLDVRTTSRSVFDFYLKMLSN